MLKRILLYNLLSFICAISNGEIVKGDLDIGYPKEISTKKDSAKHKDDFKKIQRKKSFMHSFHHNDSIKLAKQFIHHQHLIAKRKKNYQYKIVHDSLSLKAVSYGNASDFKLDYEIFGWYPFWDNDLHKSLNYPLLSTIAYFSYELNPTDGKAKTIHDWKTTAVVDSAKVHGINVVLTVTNFGKVDNEKFLENTDAIDTLIQQLKSLLKIRDANGVCIDFEGVTNKQKDRYTKFIDIVSQSLKQVNKNYLVYMTVPAVDWAKNLDFEALLPAVDKFIIMGYGYYSSESKVAGPVSLLNSGKIWDPYNITNSVNYYLTNKIPPSKLILALPYYGNIWVTESADVGAKEKSFVGDRTYAYIKSKISVPKQLDLVSQSTWCSYIVKDKETNKIRQCWFESASTLGVKLNFIKKKKLSGMGIWALGYDKGYTDLWEEIAKNMCDKKIRDDFDFLKNTTDLLSNDTVETSPSIIKPLSTITRIESIMESVTNFKLVLLLTMSFVVLFGGAGFVIAMFKSDTRIFFFGNTAYTIYYSCFVVLFLLVILRWLNIIHDLSLALILGFVAGAVTIYFTTKIVKYKNKDMP